MTPLETGLALLSTFLIFMLVMSYRLRLRRMASDEGALKHLRHDLDGAERQLRNLTDVLNHVAGGLGKRMAENAEITQALLNDDPQVFNRIPIRLYNLHAHDHFLICLHGASAMLLDSGQQRWVATSVEEGRNDLFVNAYSTTGLQRPNAFAEFERQTGELKELTLSH